MRLHVIKMIEKKHNQKPVRRILIPSSFVHENAVCLQSFHKSASFSTIHFLGGPIALNQLVCEFEFTLTGPGCIYEYSSVGLFTQGNETKRNAVNKLTSLST